MLFWLTLLQSLPIPSELDLPQAQVALLPQRPPLPTTSTQTSGIPLSARGQLLSGPTFFAGVAGAIVFLLLLAIWAYTRVYVITPNNEAFVRTGGVVAKKKTVILNGGCIVLPGFHELTRVPLREISIDVERTGKLAVRTQDYLRADMRVTFFVCINATEEDVLTAAARLSQAGRITPDDIKNALEKRADDAIRAAAKTKNLAEIDSDKLGFAQEVLNLIEPDLKKVGLTLNNIAISEVEESDTYDTNNFFDAQGVRLRTETIQKSIQQKREVELTTQVTIEQKELNAEKQSLLIQQEKESARMEQQLQLEALKAQREREIQEAQVREAATVERNKILQMQSVEEEEIRKKLAIQQSQIDADIALEERNKQLKIVQILQQQESETAEIQRQQAIESARLGSQVEIAAAERQAQIAREEAQIAIANKRRESLLAEAERVKAESGVQTARELEQAERRQRLAIISAEEEAEQRNISERNVVEIEAFRRKRQAQIAQEAAQIEAESIRILSEAERDRALAEAEGIRAKLAAQNTVSTATLTAELIKELWPDLVQQLPQTLEALAPKPGVLGDARIYSFGGSMGNGSSATEINKLLLSSSGLELLSGILKEDKLGSWLERVALLLRQPDANPPAPKAEVHQGIPSEEEG
ncbi:SPFH domain-containing protein [Thermostichus vulcanus]|uniref:Flotillin family protein n=1 Tax=Thermostichus vulcanus str. 'Rupite' TaxID=2813851 RepID=A0ABT0CC26_THEVL|nr:SPFH domain-containing protein [Thermostichus vulcanus]MCJ2543347.1 flotillin family protein [Thermostichus vulcanus str. 'Rupite']